MSGRDCDLHIPIRRLGKAGDVEMCGWALEATDEVSHIRASAGVEGCSR